MHEPRGQYPKPHPRAWTQRSVLIQLQTILPSTYVPNMNGLWLVTVEIQANQWIIIVINKKGR